MVAIKTGTFGNDTIGGSTLGDVILALGGNDTVRGLAGADLIEGGEGDDVLYANTDATWTDDDVDTVLGGIGDDHVYAGYNDILNGGLGYDRLSLDLSSADAGVTVDFRPMTLLDLSGLVTIDLGNGSLTGFEVVENLVGTAFDDLVTLGNRDNAGSTVHAGEGADTVRAGSGIDALYGEAGSDNLVGRGGADVLEGGAGDDRLNGGRGVDTLTGGAGKDYFSFVKGDTAAAAGNADRITDFSHADHDRILLRDIDAIDGGTDDRFRFIGTRAFTGTAGELHYVQQGGDTLVSGDTNGDGAADFTIRLDGSITLVSSDFGL